MTSYTKSLFPFLCTQYKPSPKPNYLLRQQPGQKMALKHPYGCGKLPISSLLSCFICTLTKTTRSSPEVPHRLNLNRSSLPDGWGTKKKKKSLQIPQKKFSRYRMRPRYSPDPVRNSWVKVFLSFSALGLLRYGEGEAEVPTQPKSVQSPVRCEEPQPGTAVLCGRLQPPRLTRE